MHEYNLLELLHTLLLDLPKMLISKILNILRHITLLPFKSN